MNRIDRLSSIIIQLQSRRTVKAKDIAERYSISLRTVYRDISSLEEAGIPIIGESGIGYSLQEGYRLPPVMFTREEATALITAEKLVAQLTDASNGNLFSNALDKIRSVMEIGEKDYLSRMEGKIEVIRNSIAQDLTQDNVLQLILAGLGGHLVMKLHYAAPYKQQETKRVIEPVGVFYVNRYWHLIAFCREKNDYRDFRFDRIKQLSATDVKFKTKHPVLKSFLNNQYKDIKLEEVTLLVDNKGAQQIGDSKYYYGYISERSTVAGIEMEFLTMSVDGFARWYISIADHAMIIHSALLKTTVKSLFTSFSSTIENI
ncbi:putative DNA-binding transcriptional regulator YafY [Pedobacter cryoconitis]|uniref:helix-turn-helix transcriptional regulator n=1 Tax=Pedobacter cryoconitis TaxID=188932 RepID=UPI001609AB13|nr:transcriptional regulator [Pedobacter cryoconitis]MBB6270920.1 putative DNA-binding transcriptional regulator YafY [Pedobacter cryoconitis]